MARALDRCPEHDVLPLWYAETEGPKAGLEVVRYDCGCLYSWEPNMLGAPTMAERVTPKPDENHT
jgi:hypothetical protein